MVNIFDGGVKLMIPQLRELTENNNHSAAYIMGSELLLEDDLKEEFEEFEAALEKKGYMDGNDSTARHYVYTKLMAKAKKKLSPDVYREFYMSF